MPWPEPAQGGRETAAGWRTNGKTRKLGCSKRTWRTIRTGADPLAGLAAAGRGDMSCQRDDWWGEPAVGGLC